MQSNESYEKYNNKEKAIVYFIASFIGIIMTFLVMIISAFITVVFEISPILLPTIASVCLAIGSFMGSFLSAKKIGNGGIISGLIISIIIFIFIFFISLFFDKSQISFNTIFHFIITLISSMIGGIIGVNKSGKI